LRDNSKILVSDANGIFLALARPRLIKYLPFGNFKALIDSDLVAVVIVIFKSGLKVAIGLI
jgi:hypothetical protein